MLLCFYAFGLEGFWLGMLLAWKAFGLEGLECLEGLEGL
jgi:hypothetical protein